MKTTSWAPTRQVQAGEVLRKGKRSHYIVLRVEGTRTSFLGPTRIFYIDHVSVFGEHLWAGYSNI